MKPRRAKLILTIAAVLLPGIGALIYASNREPAKAYYHGQSASYWLTQIYGGGYAYTGPAMQQGEALRAFRAMGTNAFPALISAFETSDEPSLYSKFYARARSSKLPN